MEALFEYLKSLKLPEGDFAVFGSGPLIVKGIIPASNDLDIICRGAAWEKVKSIGTLEHNDEYDVEIVALHDGKLSLGSKWGIGKFDIDDLIDGSHYHRLRGARQGSATDTRKIVPHVTE